MKLFSCLTLFALATMSAQSVATGTNAGLRGAETNKDSTNDFQSVKDINTEKSILANEDTRSLQSYDCAITGCADSSTYCGCFRDSGSVVPRQFCSRDLGDSIFCLPKLPEGGSCKSNQQCISGECNTVKELCLPLKPNGASCNDDSQCNSSVCHNRVCLAKVGHGQSCSTSRQCISSVECCKKPLFSPQQCVAKLLGVGCK